MHKNQNSGSGHSRAVARIFSAFGLAALLFVGGVLVSGCTKKGGKTVDVEVPGQGKLSLALNETLRVNITTEPPTLDWNKSTDTTSGQIQANIMDGLISYDLKDKELGLLPALALKWEPSENARKWKLTLRPGVKWTDGVDFTAQQVLDGWKRLLHPMTASEYSYFLFGIKNARAFSEGKIKDFAQVGAVATSPTEITVELDQPMSYFPYLLTHHSTYPVRQDLIDKHGDKWTDAANIQTLGPFKLKAWQHDKVIVLERNEGYYGEKPVIKYVVAYMIQEQATAISLFDAGKLDALDTLPSAELRNLKKRKEFRAVGTLMTYFYGLNVTKPPMNNPLVRKAISQAIDRQQIVGILAGGQIPLSSWIPSGMFGYEADRGLTFNPEKAREALKAAGYSETNKFPKLTLAFNTNEDHQRIAENVQAQLKTNLGIDVELQNEEWKVYLANMKTDPPPMFRFGWLADYPDPDNFMNLMTSYSENNRTRWKSPQYDELIKKAASETNKEKRRQLYSQAQKILVEDDVPVIPIYSGVTQHLVSDRVENYPINALRRFVYTGVKLK